MRASTPDAPSLCCCFSFSSQFLILLTALLIWEVIYILIAAISYKVNRRLGGARRHTGSGDCHGLAAILHLSVG